MSLIGYDYIIDQSLKFKQQLSGIKPPVYYIKRYDMTQQSKSAHTKPGNWFFSFYPFIWDPTGKRTDIYYSFRYVPKNEKIRFYLSVDLPLPKQEFKEQVKALTTNIALPDYFNYFPNAGFDSRKAKLLSMEIDKSDDAHDVVYNSFLDLDNCGYNLKVEEAIKAVRR